MTERARNYSRVYWSVMDDEKFDGIRDDPRHFGSWLLMLIVAEMAHPRPAFIPAAVSKPSLRSLTACGLVDILPGGRYRMHGLTAEREMRSQSARNAAAVRWQSDGNANGMLGASNAKPMLERERGIERGISGVVNGVPARAPSARPNTVDRDPLLRQIREVYEAKDKG